MSRSRSFVHFLVVFEELSRATCALVAYVLCAIAFVEVDTVNGFFLVVEIYIVLFFLLDELVLIRLCFEFGRRKVAT